MYSILKRRGERGGYILFKAKHDDVKGVLADACRGWRREELGQKGVADVTIGVGREFQRVQTGRGCKATVVVLHLIYCDVVLVEVGGHGLEQREGEMGGSENKWNGVTLDCGVGEGRCEFKRVKQVRFPG